MKAVYIGEDPWVIESLEARGWSILRRYSPLASAMILDLRDRDEDEALSEFESRLVEVGLVSLIPDHATELAARLTSSGVRVIPDCLLTDREGHSARLLVQTVEQAALHRSQISSDLERTIYELLGLHALAQAVSTSLNAETVSRRALDVVGGLIPHASIAIYVADPRPTLSGELAPTKSGTSRWTLTGASKRDEGFPEELQNSLVDPILESSGTLTLSPDDELSKLLCDETARTAAVVVPIPSTAGPVGLLALCHSQSPDEMYQRRHVLNSVAAQLGTALENAWLFDEIGVAYSSLQNTQEQLVRAEKFAATGLLAAEIAHEINNPSAFIITNLSVMEEYVDTIANFHEALEDALDRDEVIDRAALDRLKVEHEIEFLDEDLEALVRRSLVGLERIHQIVMDLRHFSREDGGSLSRVDLESLLSSVVSLVRHEAKYKAEIAVELEGIPPITSDANRLSQVFLNLLLNSVQAIEEGARDHHVMQVTGEVRDGEVCLQFSDDGPGIPRNHQDRIFQPFFTTKEPGSGTGLGLSISRDIVRALGGDIEFVDRKPGATFRVRLPFDREDP